MSKSKLAREYIEKYIEIALKTKRQFSKRYIANVLYNEHSDVFKDSEDARRIIRGELNASGNRDRFKSKDELARQFALIPEQIKELRDTTPFVVPKAIKKTLWVSDVHGRFYDKNALETAINYAINQKCDSVIINGDFLDFYGHSKFDKNPSISIIFDEQEWGQDILELLQNTFGTVILKEGNHDIRRKLHIERLSATMPELMGMSEYSDYLFFDKCHVNFVEDYRHIIYGKLNGIHGHEFYGGGGIHVAHNRFNKALDNVISGHSHKAQSIIRKDINDNILGSWTTGCMCHDDKTEILTENGFVFFKDLSKNERVMEFNKDNGTLELLLPIKYQVYSYSGMMYNFSSRRIDQCVTPDHKMLAHRSDGMGKGGYLDISALELYNRKRNLNLTVAGYVKNDYDIKENILGELMGFIITDGSYREGSGGIRIYQKNKYERVKFLLESLGIDYNEYKSREIPVFAIPTKFGKVLRELNPIKNEISRTLLNKDLGFLLGLYEGLIGGDGHRNKRNTDYFSTHSKETALQFQELCLKIGYSCFIKLYEGVGNNITDKAWFMYKCHVRKFNTCEVKSKDEIQYSGMVYDITTKNGYFVVRRNGKVSISGNCDLNPRYSPKNDWTQGFAVTSKDSDGNFDVDNRVIHKNRTYPV